MLYTAWKSIFILNCNLFLDGTTIHSALNLGFGNEYPNLTTEKRQELAKIFIDLQIIVCDEFSMVGADKFHQIDKRLQEIIISRDTFAGKAILFVGDILQLPPVQARPIFSKPRVQDYHLKFNSDLNLWENLEVVTLSKNFR